MHLCSQLLQRWIQEDRNDTKAPNTCEGLWLEQVKLAGDLI
jgi:hypothetical protein